MAKLVDAPASGAGDRKVVGVRFPCWAPNSLKSPLRALIDGSVAPLLNPTYYHQSIDSKLNPNLLKTSSNKNKGISLFSATALGIGWMMGAGLFSLLGTASAHAGTHIPLAFLLGHIAVRLFLCQIRCHLS